MALLPTITIKNRHETVFMTLLPTITIKDCHETDCMTLLPIIIIIYNDFLPTPRRGSHVKSGKTHTQSSRYTP